jgi:hypothetical protein
MAALACLGTLAIISLRKLVENWYQGSNWGSDGVYGKGEGVQKRR